MKLIAALCALVSLTSGSHYYHPAPLNHDGTVADTHEVAALKAKHLAELAKAGGAIVYAPHYGNEHYEEAQWDDHHSVHTPHTYVESHVEHAYHGPHAPLNHDGTVDETPEVKHAKAYHFAEHAKALGRIHYGHTPIHTHYEEASYHSPLAYAHYAPHHQPAPLKHDGTVDDTPEIKHAKAVHFAAHAAAKSHYPIQTYLADTPEVEHAKALHFAAHHKALYRGRRSSYQIYEPELFSGHVSGHVEQKYHGPPAPLNHDGTVDDTPEVKHAKAEHFKAHAAAKYGAYHTPAQHAEPVHTAQPVYHAVQPVYHAIQPVYHNFAPVHHYAAPAPLNHDGTVAETPEIIARKYEHFAEHQKALARLSPVHHSYY